MNYEGDMNFEGKLHLISTVRVGQKGFSRFVLHYGSCVRNGRTRSSTERSLPHGTR